MEKLDKDFFKNSAIFVAKNLIGKVFCAQTSQGVIKSVITETEAYLGEEDSASHARFGKDKNGKMMWEEGGTIGIYLCYGLHYMLNITCGEKGDPQAVLIRGTALAVGPGRVTKTFEVNMQDNGHSVCDDYRIWIEDGATLPSEATARIGIDFANKKDRERKLRFVAKMQLKNSTKSKISKK